MSVRVQVRRWVFYEKNATPSQRSQKETTDQWSSRDCHTPCRGPNTDCPSAQSGVVSARVIQDGKGARHQQSGSNSLDGSSGVEEAGSGSQATGQRGCSETEKSSNEDTFCAQAIADDSRRKEQCREAKRIGIDHPLQLGHGRPQIFTDPGKGYIDNGYVELNYREGKATGRDNPRHRASWSICGHEIACLHRGAIWPIYRIRLHN